MKNWEQKHREHMLEVIRDEHSIKDAHFSNNDLCELAFSLAAERDEARKLAEELNSAINALLSDWGICSDVDDPDDVCAKDHCSYCDLVRLANGKSLPWEEK